ncbi:MAG: HD family phosphohydrolase [Bacteroidales bacterium]
MMPFFIKHRNAIPFFVAAVLIVYFLPREGKFQYEFQRGTVWQHSTLLAPFDFPIYKDEAELSNERQLIKNSTALIYEYDSIIAQSQLLELRKTLQSRLRQQFNIQRSKAALLSKQIDEAVRFIYQKGIREPHLVNETYLSKTGSLLIIRHGAISQDIPAADCFTPQMANVYLQNKLFQISPNNLEEEFISSLNLSSFLKANLFYDEALTVNLRQHNLQSLSPTKGMVSIGEHIVSQGEVVNANVYSKLFSLQQEYEQRAGYAGSKWVLLLGQILFTLIFLSSLYIYIYRIDSKKTLTFKKNAFLMLLLIGFFTLTKLINRTEFVNIYSIPFAALPILVCTFFSSGVAVMLYLITTLLSSWLVPNSFEFFLLSLFAGLIAVYTSKNAYRRSRLFLSAGLVFVTYSLMFFALSLIKDGYISFSWDSYMWFVLNASLIVAMYQLVYVLEKIFGFTSDNTFIELSDTNHPILRELAELAPATFQHCMQVANLAESAIRQIGGNPLLIRAGALYHDIGKMANPIYFIENRRGDFLPLAQLEPEESARIIKQHVSDGVSIARKHRLPQIIIDFISTHHGTSPVRYFLAKYKEKHPEETDFSEFSYSGPNPTTKEQGVLMMSDAIEAASRTLSSYSAESISSLVDGVVEEQMKAQMLNDTNLTLSDIRLVKRIIKKKLQDIYHDRVIADKTVQMVDKTSN